MHRRDWAVFRSLLLAADDGTAGGGANAAADRAADTSDATTATKPAASSGAAASVEGGSSSSQAATTGVDMAQLRDLVLKANPDVIPEMIAGDSFDSLLASVEPARAAYSRIVAQVNPGAQNGAEQAPRVPAGGGASRQFVVNIEELSPSAKIAEGLRQRNAKRS